MWHSQLSLYLPVCLDPWFPLHLLAADGGWCEDSEDGLAKDSIVWCYLTRSAREGGGGDIVGEVIRVTGREGL